MRAVQADTLSATAVHDAVVGLTQSDAYNRSLQDSLWLKLTNWMLETLSSLFRGVREFPGGELIAYSLIATLVFLVVARMFIGTRATRAVRKRKASNGELENGAIGWSDAGRFAALGDYTAAAHSLYAATIGLLSARGAVRFHPSKTTGDYARELRKKHHWAYPLFQGFRGVYDHVIYGELTCSPEAYQELLRFAKSIRATNVGSESSAKAGFGRDGDKDSRNVAA